MYVHSHVWLHVDHPGLTTAIAFSPDLPKPIRSTAAASDQETGMIWRGRTGM